VPPLHHRRTGLAAVLAVTGLAFLSGCATPKPPSAADIAGEPPSGRIRMTEIIEGGVIKGDGEVEFGGVVYRFKVTGKLLGAGPAFANISGEGDVYFVNRVQSFVGRYGQAAGVGRDGGSAATDLWLRGNGGAIIHLRTRSATPMAPMGEAEIYIPQVL
jgi:hypothetical protein